MDKDVLRRLGWSEELIETASVATMGEPLTAIPSVTSGLDVFEAEVGSTVLDLSSLAAVGSPVLPPPWRGGERT